MTILAKILNSVGVPSDHLRDVDIQGRDPILPTPFFVGEAGAAVLAAVGYLIVELNVYFRMVILQLLWKG